MTLLHSMPFVAWILLGLGCVVVRWIGDES